MIKKLACVSVLAAALLVSAPLAEAAPVPVPEPSAGVPGGPLLNGLLGSLEVGHPATSPQSLLPAGILGR
ncbi:hypothetical protein ACFUIW_19975 [Streptomyces sp. NPDC057245]|uniref:hypothetical protein n=1 Tax=Streptomyces TaxID=1883 RepID=UPI001C1E389C|nr:hypothetical protein [Streptomyces sp. A108]MBU6533505.1 hypothetical protein [Streptomyces sp. A108]